MCCVCVSGEVFEGFWKRWALLETAFLQEENSVPISFPLRAVRRVEKA